MTAGKTEVRLEVRSNGPIWGYGRTFEQYQKPMTQPTRGTYSLATHTDGCFVPPPDEEARIAILKIHLGDLPSEPLDLVKVAKATDRFSGADLRAVVERATETVIAQELKGATDCKLTQRIVMDAAKQTRPSTAEWLETAKSYASYSNRSGLYDDLAQYLESH